MIEMEETQKWTDSPNERQPEWEWEETSQDILHPIQSTVKIELLLGTWFSLIVLKRAQIVQKQTTLILKIATSTGKNGQSDLSSMSQKCGHQTQWNPSFPN